MAWTGVKLQIKRGKKILLLLELRTSSPVLTLARHQLLPSAGKGIMSFEPKAWLPGEAFQISKPVPSHTRKPCSQHYTFLLANLP